MNWFNENKNNSYVFSSKSPISNDQICTPCCPYDTRNLLHPKVNSFFPIQTDVKENGSIKNLDTCCLNNLRVDCRIRCHKTKRKRKKWMKINRYDSLNLSPSIKRSISSSSQLSPIPKRTKIDSITNTNSHYIQSNDIDSQTSSSSLSTETEATEKTFSSLESEKRYNQNKSASISFTPYAHVDYLKVR